MDVSTIRFTALSQVVDVGFFGNAVALLVLLFLAGRPAARRLENRLGAIPLAILVGLCVTVLLTAAPWPFAKTPIAVVLVGLSLFNLIPIRNKTEPTVYDGKLAFWLVALLWVTFLAANASPFAFMHYDYFHASMRSLELARSGTAFSPWLQQFDASGWFLIDQTTSLALDGLEVVWFGTQTGILSKLVVVLLASYLILTLGRLRIAGPMLVVVATALCLYLLDSAFAFRPHIYVGLTLAVIAAQLAQLRANTGKLVAAMLVLLVLAKRDGLVLAPFVGMLAYWRVIGARRAPRINVKVALPIGVALLGLLVAGLSFAQIGGVAVGQQLLVSMTQLDAAQLVQRGVMALLALCVALPAVSFALVRNGDTRWRLFAPLVLLVIVAGLIAASGILLEGGSRFNESTLLRKLLYFLLPPALTFLALAFPTRTDVTHGGRNALEMKFNSLAGAFLATFLAYQLQDVTSPRYGWGKIAIEATDFFRSVVPADATAAIGFLVPQPDAIARSPFGEIDSYQFPIMTAYLGRNLRFAPTMGDLSDRDVIFLPRSMPPAGRLEVVQQSGRTYRELDGGYGLALNPAGLAAVSPRYILSSAQDGPIDTPLVHIPWKFVDKTWPEQFRIAEVARPGDVTQVMAAWPEDGSDLSLPLTISFPNPKRKRVFSVEFADHPLGDRKPETIKIITSVGSTEAPAQRYYAHGRYVLPVNSDQPFAIAFTADATRIEPPWMAPYFVIFDLQVLQENQ